MICCDACFLQLDGEHAVMRKPCGHRVHSGKCEGEGVECRACLKDDAFKKGGCYLMLLLFGIVCGFLLNFPQGMKNDVNQHLAEIHLNLARINKLATVSPHMRPAIIKSLERVAATVAGEMAVCGVK